MQRNKRTTAVEKIAASVPRERTVSACHVLYQRCINVGIERSLTAQESGFALVLVPCECTPEIHSPTHSSQRRNPRVGKRGCMRYGGGILCDVSLYCRVGGDQSNCEHSERHSELPLPLSHPKWRRQQRLLILQDIE